MKFLPIIVFILGINTVFAQKVDSLSVLKKDSVLSKLTDTLLTKKDSVKTKKSDIDTVIYAQSTDSIIYYIDQKKMDIFGKGQLQYKDTDLKSANIYVDFNTNFLHAEGTPSDTAVKKYINTPILKDKNEEYDGIRLKYNFKTKQGFITEAATETDGAYYTGQKINKVNKDVFFIQDGEYTTCNAAHPHYNFYASSMKVINKDQIIARWIWLYFGGVPMPVPIPFAVFPVESGRRSGILPPAFGDKPGYGKYFSRFGYYWAISDYMDINLTGDYYTRGSYNANSLFRYAKRYEFTGQLELGYSDMKYGEYSDPDYSRSTNWKINWSHNQKIDPTSSLNGNLQFMSGKDYFTKTSTSINDNLNRNIYSNLTYFKTWEESGNSLSMSYSRSQNLDNGNIYEVLPTITFNKSQTYPFKSENSVGEQKWYELIGFNYYSQFQNNRNKVDDHLDIRGGIKHSLTTNFSPKIGYFNISPNFTFTEYWYNKQTKKYTVKTSTGKDSVVTEETHKLGAVHTFNTGVSATTRFYGMFQPNVLGVSAVRHTVTPSIAYRYTPDFSKPFWGYYGSYRDSTGKMVKYDKYRDQIFGGASSRESQALDFSVNNLFEMKTKVDPTDTTSKEKKIQLLNLTANTSYNFTADSLKLSPLRLTFYTQIGDLLNFNGGTGFSFYEVGSNKQEINKLLISEKKGPLRLTDFNINISTSLTGEKLKSSTAGQPAAVDSVDKNEGLEMRQTSQKSYRGLYEEKEADFTIPWSLTLNYSFYYYKLFPNANISNISGNIDFNLTPAWKFSFTGSYDLKNKKLAAPQITISRDLHCWIMNFHWNPMGSFRGYWFEIKVKAPQLQDLKLTKQDSFYSGK